MPIIYRKTAKGLAEIETRVYRLTPRLRSLLIMVDGKRTDAELLQMMPQAAEAINALAQDDFIAEFSRLAAAPPAPAPVAPPAAPERTVIRPPQAGFEAMRKDLLRAFNDRLGPAGEGMAVRMEKARNETEFRALLPSAVQLVATLQGREAAESFTARINAW